MTRTTTTAGRPRRAAPALAVALALASGLTGAGGVLAPLAHADGVLPNRTYRPDQQYTVISPPMGMGEDHNQPSVVNGFLMLAGNASHQIWDIADPFAPRQVSSFRSNHADGEAESHQVAFARTSDGRTLCVTISGRGVDLWDLTDPTSPVALAEVLLEGVEYGDNTEAVWGVAWQGDVIYVGGTNTGLHLVDASDPRAPEVIARIPVDEFGGVSAGPLFALGNLLVITTPKNRAGIATLDISDPRAPRLLDFVLPETDSYIGAFFGRHAYLLTPFRTYDVTTDPSDIVLLGSDETVPSEYLAFGDDRLFLGALRPNPGVLVIDHSDPDALVTIGKVEGRRDDFFNGAFTDDQFPLPVGNLLVLSDDEINIGSVLGVHDWRRDTTPPAVRWTNPGDGEVGLPVSSRLVVSFSDQIDLRSVDPSTIVVRPVGALEGLPGTYGHQQTLIGFWPDEPFEADTTYELVVPAGGVTDLAGNAVAEPLRVVFSTGDAVSELPCAIDARAPAEVGDEVAFAAVGGAGRGEADAEELEYTWFFGDGGGAAGESAQHRYEEPGRWRVRLQVSDGLRQRSCSALQVVHRPLLPVPPLSAGTVLVRGGVAWVVNHDAGTLTAVDLGASEVLAEHTLDAAPLRAGPRTVSADGDGRLWVALGGADAVVALDAESGAEVARVGLGRGSAPYGVLWVGGGGGASGGEAGAGTVFVTLEGTGELVAIDPEAGEVVERVSVVAGGDGAPIGLRGLAYDPSRDRLWVTRFISPESAGEVYPVEAAILEVGAPVALAIETTPDTSNAGRGLPNYLASVVVSPDGARAAVPSKKDNVERGLARDGQPLSVDNTVRTIVSFIDLDGGPGGGLEGGAELIEARIDLDNHDLANAAAYSPLGDLLFVASQGTNQVDVFDAYTGQLQTAFATGLAPQGLALTGDGRLVVQNFLSRSLGVYDIEPLLAGRDGVVRQLAEVVTVAEEPLAPEVLLGKQIFYNADSPQMSRDGYLSCASCHLDGGHDGRVWDFSDRGEGLRNTIDLRGRGGMRQGPLHWTGNFDEVQDFEGDIRRHFGGTGFLADADWDETSDSLGAGKGGRSAALDALAAYVATLDEVPPSPYGRGGAAGGDAEAVSAGAALFVERGCADCHGGGELTDSPRGVRHDVGTARTASGQRLGGPLDGFDTPTLRGVWATAPYLHDGSAPTLAEALVGEAHVGDLAEGERDLLVAYLLSLDGDSAGVEDPGGPGLDGAGDAGGGDGDAGSDMGLDRGPDAGADASDLGGDGGATGSRETDEGCAGCSAGRRTTGPGPAGWVWAPLAALAFLRRRRG